jgi:hypothetical protein
MDKNTDSVELRKLTSPSQTRLTPDGEEEVQPHRDKRASALHDWLETTKQDQHRLQLGVSFRDLDCNGSRPSSLQYQATFLTALVKPLQTLRARHHQQVRIVHRAEDWSSRGRCFLFLGVQAAAVLHF